MQESDTILTQLRELFATQPLAILSTDSDSRPYASLVAFAASSDLRRLFFATTRASYWNEGWRISGCRGVDDFTSAVAVTVLGDSRELTGAERADAERLYLTKHPNLGRTLNF